ncbi:MAG: extracellular solute-binding protein [Pseudohongiellaceae bacterium]|nr:extracellular solute-binding protein [Pseudohongiellaceae bacterium]
MKTNISAKFLLASVVCLLAACGGEPEQEQSQPLPEGALTGAEQAREFYAANPDFFSFKTPEDIPENLEWETGLELPEIGSPNATKGGVQYSSIPDFPRTLRIVGPDSNGAFRNWILDNVAVKLAHRHPDEFDFYPGLATAWALEEETKTVYIKLDPDARWSDGEPVTADDYFFLFFFNRSEHIVAPWYNNWYSTQYTNISKYDDYTISLTMPEMDPDIIYNALEHTPTPEHFYDEFGPDYVERYQWRFVPTTGAYYIKDEDIIKGRSVTLTRDENWWAKDKKFWRNRYNADKVHLSVIRDSSKVFESFKVGDLDSFGLTLAEYWYDKLPDSDPDVQAGYIHKSVFYNQRPRPSWGISINSDRELLNNQDIRVGINYATNWDLVIERYFRGEYDRMKTFSDGFGEFSHPTLAARPFDIDLAQEHFAAAGFTQRGPDGVLVNEQGQRLSFTLTTGAEPLAAVFTILREEALKAGLEYRIEILDGSAAFKKVLEKQHDVYFGAFGRFLEFYPRFWDELHSDNAYDDAFLDDGSVNPDRQIKVQTNNLQSFANFEVDQLIAQYDSSTDVEEMISLAHEIFERHHEYASFVPAYVVPFYRVGHWRWMKFPEGFNHKHSESAGELFVHWIDTELKEETLAARRSGDTFEPQINVYDQFRSEN